MTIKNQTIDSLIAIECENMYNVYPHPEDVEIIKQIMNDRNLDCEFVVHDYIRFEKTSGRLIQQGYSLYNDELIFATEKDALDYINRTQHMKYTSFAQFADTRITSMYADTVAQDCYFIKWS